MNTEVGSIKSAIDNQSARRSGWCKCCKKKKSRIKRQDEINEKRIEDSIFESLNSYNLKFKDDKLETEWAYREIIKRKYDTLVGAVFLMLVTLVTDFPAI